MNSDHFPTEADRVCRYNALGMGRANRREVSPFLAFSGGVEMDQP